MKGFVEKVYLHNGWQGIIIFAEILDIQNLYENLSRYVAIVSYDECIFIVQVQLLTH